MNAGRRSPPRVLLAAFAWTLPPADRDAVTGDLIEEYELRASTDRAAAIRWLLAQLVTSFGPNMRRRFIPEEFQPAHSGGSIMHGALTDLRFSARLLKQQPLLALVALTSLLVGLGLNVLLFTVANAVLYRPLPVRDPGSLALFARQRPTSVQQNFPYRAYEALASRGDVLEMTAAYAGRAAGLRFGEQTVSTNGEVVTGTFFEGLGIRVAAGRGLGVMDDRTEAPPAAVVSQSLWRERYGNAPLAGQTLIVNGSPFTIVGIAAEPFRGMFAGSKADFWIPIAHAAVITGRDLRPLPMVSWLFVIGRLAPGVTLDTARTSLDPALLPLFQAAGVQPEPLIARPGARGSDMLSDRLEGPLHLLMFAAGFVLLVACVNVANLQLARNAARRRELAVRAALGARHVQLVRLLLVDAAVLVLPASLLAILVAWFGRHPALALITRFGEPVKLAAPVDGQVIAFAALLAVGCALVVGLLSSWHATRLPAAALADGGRADTGSRHRLQRGLVVLQFALSMALLVGAALLVRSVANLRSIDLGFATNVVLVETMPGDAKLAGSARTRYVEAAMARAATVPGVLSVSAASVVPLDFGGSRMTLGIPDYQPAPGEDVELNYLRVMPGYFETMEIPLLRGRTIDASDVDGAPIAVVVNETMARRFWPNGDAVGRRVGVFGQGTLDGEVVGVVRDAHYRMVREDRQASFYVPFAQSPFFQAAIHARTAGDPAALVDTLRRVVAEVNPQVPVARATSLEGQMLRNISDDRMAQALGVVLAGAALLLAAAGLYGTMAFSVRRRTREIGVRVALGAAIADVRRLILRQGLVLVLLGAAAGALTSFAVGHALAGQLYGVAPIDPVSIAAALGVLSVVAVAAVWIPARRATRIDPIVALRE